MTPYRLTSAAQSDIASILDWSEDEFGAEARNRYRSLIAAAMRDVASSESQFGCTPRPELGEGVFSWHLSQSRAHSPGGRVRRPRRFLVCLRDGDTLVVGRVLHDAMDLRRHVDREQPWT